MTADEITRQKSQLEKVLRHLKEHKDTVDISDTAPSSNFVTISRQSGAGGHLLSYVLLTDMAAEEDQEVFGEWYVFDKELCELIAQDDQLRDSVQALLSERYKSEFQEYMESLFSNAPSQYVTMKKAFQIVRTLASVGKIIMVGRAASFVTGDFPGGIHVRLVAPETTRERWMRRKLNISKEEAISIIKTQDSDRSKIVKTFFNKNIDDPTHYHITSNSETTGMHEISHAIIAMIKARNRQILANRAASRDA